MSRRLLEWAIRSWPEPARTRDGRPALEAFTEELRQRGVAGLRLRVEVLREARALVAEGLAMRLRGRRAGSAAPLAGWATDVRLALRSLRRNPGYSSVVAITLAFGIGANAAVFGVVHSVLFTPPPFDRPDELVFVWETMGGGDERFRVPAPDVAEIRDAVPALEAVAFVDRVVDGAIEDDRDSAARHVRIAAVTPDLFELLGVEPILGRTFGVDDAAPEVAGNASTAPVGLLSWNAWSRLFARDASVVGRNVRIDGRSVTLIGVLPEGFRIVMPPGTGVASDGDVWLPLTVALQDFERSDGRLTDQDSDNTGAVIARRGARANLLDVDRQLDRLAADLRTRFPAYAASEVGFSARPLHDDATAHVRGLLTALIGGVVVLLIVTCANVATLVVSRSVRRRPELAVRSALGASSLRIARQLATEIALLVGIGATLALGTSAMLGGILATRIPADAMVTGGGLGIAMIGLAAGLAAVVMLSFGLAPMATASWLRAGASPTVAVPRARLERDRTRGGLVVAQLALSISLLLGTALLVRTLQELRGVEPGFEPQSALTFSLSLRAPGRYRGPRDRAELARTIENRLSAIPGVRAAGLTTHLPLSSRRWSQPYGLPGQAPFEWSENRADFRAVTSSLFDALGAHLLDGRGFTSDEDLREDRRVVIVDELLARRIAPDGSAVGRMIGIPLDGDAVEAVVVGVVGHVRSDRLQADGREAIYVPYRQEASRDVSFVVRTVGEPESVAPAVRAAMAEIDPQLAVYELRTLADYVEAALGPTRFALDGLGLFAALALAAVGLGLYGIVALDVARQRPAIGVRVALGASRHQVVRSVVLRGSRLVALGSALGVAISLGVSAPLKAYLFGTGLYDWRVWLSVVGVVALVTVAGCWVPARRAASVDPADALRGA